MKRNALECNKSLTEQNVLINGNNLEGYNELIESNNFKFPNVTTNYISLFIIYINLHIIKYIL